MLRRTIAMMGVLAVAISCGALSASAQQRGGAGEIEAMSLLGEPLERPQFPADVFARLVRNLDEAELAYRAEPEDESAIIWYGRRLGYVGRYREAIDVFTKGLDVHPHSFRLLRHRGHRWITLREFRKAIADLKRAAELVRSIPDEVEPDGAPNAKNIPRSTMHSNIFYHLALAKYLLGDFEGALPEWRRCLAVSTNDDMKVATLNWLYLTLRRVEKHDEAADVLAFVKPEMDIIENFAYHRLLLFYKGLVPLGEMLEDKENDLVAGATIAYGVGAWLWVEGKHDEAAIVWRGATDVNNWGAFGVIAAEAERARLRKVDHAAPR